MPFQVGMSLRDWFAGQALAGLLASEPAWFTRMSSDCPATAVPDREEHIASHAYSLADAMLTVRKQLLEGDA